MVTSQKCTGIVNDTIIRVKEYAHKELPSVWCTHVAHTCVHVEIGYKNMNWKYKHDKL